MRLRVKRNLARKRVAEMFENLSLWDFGGAKPGVCEKETDLERVEIFHPTAWMRTEDLLLYSAKAFANYESLEHVARFCRLSILVARLEWRHVKNKPEYWEPNYSRIRKYSSRYNLAYLMKTHFQNLEKE
jgi:hypothetical protein